jgi:aerobic-type carbon monoxide dehydrogenase small subunit (CoxS/CutS family)
MSADAIRDDARHHVRAVNVTVNGKACSREVESRLSLADFLRHELGLTGTHLGCEHGVCGACTVLVDGQTARSCLMLAVQANGADIMTVEGLSPSATAGNPNPLNPLQQAFWDKHGLQCGFCTPGVLMTLTELLRDQPQADEKAIREALSGHLCRCTGYQNIVAAALECVARNREESGQTIKTRA